MLFKSFNSNTTVATIESGTAYRSEVFVFLVFSGIRVAHSLVLCVVFFGHCIMCSPSIYDL